MGRIEADIALESWLLGFRPCSALFGTGTVYPIYRRYIAQCRLKSVGFTTSRKINSLRVLRSSSECGECV